MRTTIADGGIETALEERLGQSLPEFAAFVLLDTVEGRAALTDYYRPFVEIARESGIPLALDTPTWRASGDWGTALGYDAEALTRANAAAARLTREVAEGAAPDLDLTIGGCIGPRFDDPAPEERMTAAESEKYHAPQVRALASAGVDRIGAVTMGDAPEALGVVRAAHAAGVPVTISFAVGEDGRLSDGTTLEEAIGAVDAETNGYPVGYLVNCAHPSEAARALEGEGFGEAGSDCVAERVIGFRLNAARHGEEAGEERGHVVSGVLRNPAVPARAGVQGLLLRAEGVEQVQRVLPVVVLVVPLQQHVQRNGDPARLLRDAAGDEAPGEQVRGCDPRLDGRQPDPDRDDSAGEPDRAAEFGHGQQGVEGGLPLGHRLVDQGEHETVGDVFARPIPREDCLAQFGPRLLECGDRGPFAAAGEFDGG
ncbi:MAG: homocysteine S-methyltransferase family protein [Leucobacter sp.]